MTNIKILSDDTINKIAAGEVVGRPVSVIKELVENSIDAGASRIKIEVQNGGKSFIRVTDDGSGMDEQDAKLCLVRHATSKISNEQDLFFLTTMGFRGEALPSIAAVSKFTLQTTQKEKTIGTEIIIEGGKEIAVRQLPLTEGTCITVKDLFYNVPARLKYLKTDKSELGHILRLIQSIALVYPQIAFNLYSEQKKAFAVSGNGRHEDVLSEVMASQVAKDMKKITYEQDDIIIQGYISTPSETIISRDKQIFIVNKRVVQCDLLAKAIRKATYYIYPQGRYPYLYLQLDIDPSVVDVNVHPAKLEVKFANESAIYKAVSEALKDIFLVNNSIYQNIPQTNWPVPEKTGGAASNFQSMNYSHSTSVEASTRDLLFSVVQEVPTTTKPERQSFEGYRSVQEPSMDVLQVNNTYLLYWQNENLFIIDQHIAHERVLYEQLKNKDHIILSQELLMPETIFLDQSEDILLAENRHIFENLGFGIEDFGKGSYLLRSVPTYLTHKPVKNIIRDVLAELTEKDPDKRYQQVLISLSCKTAVKAGDVLTDHEKVALIKDWQKTSNNMSCPHGRPIAKMFCKSEVDKWFMR